MAESLKQKTVKGLAWSAVEKFSTSGVNFVFNILIARILMPSDYGMVAMLGIFLAVCNCFIDSGFANALIRKLDRTEADFNTVFYFNFFISLVTYFVLYVTAPAIAQFYEQPLLTKITRLVGLNLIIGALSRIQGAKLSIDLDFKLRAISSFLSATLSGAVGLWLAYKGYGVIALVFQTLTSSLIRTILLWVLVKWYPKLMFSWESFKSMFSYGSRLLISSLIDTIYNNMYPLVIGKFFTSSSLGNYSRAENIAMFPSSGISGVISSVTFPAFSSIQNEEERLISFHKKSIRLSAFIIFPMMTGFAAIADPFIRLCLTDKWEEAIPFMQLLCFALLFWPIDSLNINIIQAKGRSDYYLHAEIFRKLIGILTLVCSIPFGLMAICVGRIVSGLASFAVLAKYSQKVIGVGIKEQLKAILPTSLLSMFMFFLVYAIVRILPNLYLQLGIGILCGFTFYILLARIFRMKELDDLADLLMSKLKK